jgi:purine nucleoside permease
MPRKGYEEYRVFKLNPELVAAAVRLGSAVELRDSPEAQAYRKRYPDAAAQAKPALKTARI